ncbi:hypothetical protein JHK85_053285 [Glycine max]|nr:hypothetical protein JHK85_053285 [Glycine max]
MESLMDDDENITRFLVLAREPIIPGTNRPHKISLTAQPRFVPMASTLQKLLRKPLPLPPFRFITALNPPQPQNQNPVLTLTLNPPQQCHPQPFDDSPTVIFPSFPFGFSPKPVFESGFRGAAEEEEDSSGTLWADSVKKKRKKKMNKHKYQKLRKRMRRQT